MVAERDTRGSGSAGEWLALAIRIGVLLAAIGILSVIGMIWASYLRGRQGNPIQSWLEGASDAGPPIPEGAVIAVQGETCPRPWQTYLPAQGRFILGAGAGGALNLDANGNLTPVRKPGDTGGRAGVELRIEEIPPHTHRLAVGKSARAGPHEQTVSTFSPVSVVVGTPDGEPMSGILAPFAIKRGSGWRDYDVVTPLELHRRGNYE